MQFAAGKEKQITTVEWFEHSKQCDGRKKENANVFVLSNPLPQP